MRLAGAVAPGCFAAGWPDGGALAAVSVFDLPQPTRHKAAIAVQAKAGEARVAAKRRNDGFFSISRFMLIHHKQPVRLGKFQTAVTNLVLSSTALDNSNSNRKLALTGSRQEHARNT